MKVLIVDDSPGNLRLLRAVLEADDYEVVEASDGMKALTVLEREAVDAIISDILMPRMDGYRLCYEVRKSERWHALPFIFYTATYTSPSDERLCYDLGGDKYLQKPATAETILAALREAMTDSWRSRPYLGLTLSESDVTNQYSERLVAKLEVKNVELAQAKERLEETNQRLEQAGAELLKANEELELRVRQRTAELQSSNEKLEAFVYSISHDLRTPLWVIGNFSEIVLNNAAPKLAPQDAKYLQNIHVSAKRLNALIDAMLELSHTSNAPLYRLPVDLTAMAGEVIAELHQSDPERNVQVQIASGMTAAGDQRLLRTALMNLLANAWKFTSKCPDARIEFGRIQDEPNSHYYVRDNGAGFDMAYAKKLFTPFQRLHSRDEFEGSGIGLSTVQRIVERHGGRIWAEGAPDNGATFYFTLGENTPHPEQTHE
jgi:signal transduction histidine kinase